MHSLEKLNYFQVAVNFKTNCDMIKFSYLIRRLPGVNNVTPATREVFMFSDLYISPLAAVTNVAGEQSFSPDGKQE